MTHPRLPESAAAAQWRAQLAAWQIPEVILAKAPESPYGFPVGMFQAEPEQLPNTSQERALEALPSLGTVLDVGCGGGQASMALVPPAGRVVGVDNLPAMLAAFSCAADARGVEHAEVLGTWPETSVEPHSADVVVAHHIVYNVPALADFALALSAAARTRVVLELTDVHPWVPTNALWRLFHDLDRPQGPTSTLAAEVLLECGLPVQAQSWLRPARSTDRAEIVSFIRRRLCLPLDREGEVDAALPTNYQFTQRAVTTLWWDCAGENRG